MFRLHIAVIQHNEGNGDARVEMENNKFVQCFSTRMYGSFTNFKTFIIVETLLLKTSAERQVFIMNVATSHLLPTVCYIR